MKFNRNCWKFYQFLMLKYTFFDKKSVTIRRCNITIMLTVCFTCWIQCFDHLGAKPKGISHRTRSGNPASSSSSYRFLISFSHASCFTSLAPVPLTTFPKSSSPIASANEWKFFPFSRLLWMSQGAEQKRIDSTAPFPTLVRWTLQWRWNLLLLVVVLAVRVHFIWRYWYFTLL